MNIETTEIRDMQDVKRFFKEMHNKGLAFHPDEDFENYTNKKSKDLFSKREADRLDFLMKVCFDICDRAGKDIYGIALYAQTK